MLGATNSFYKTFRNHESTTVNALQIYSILVFCYWVKMFYLFMCILRSLNLSFNLGIYFSVCLALMVISLLETVIITNVLHHSTMKYKEVPNWVRVVVLKHIGNLICYRFPEDIQPPYLPQKDKPENSNGVPESCIIQPASQSPAQHPTSNGGNQT